VSWLLSELTDPDRRLQQIIRARVAIGQLGVESRDLTPTVDEPLRCRRKLARNRASRSCGEGQLQPADLDDRAGKNRAVYAVGDLETSLGCSGLLTIMHKRTIRVRRQSAAARTNSRTAQPCCGPSAEWCSKREHH
jgi:hypothetical protein